MVTGAAFLISPPLRKGGQGEFGRARLLPSTRSHVPRRVVKRNSHEFSYVHALTENSEFLGSRQCTFAGKNAPMGRKPTWPLSFPNGTIFGC